MHTALLDLEAADYERRQSSLAARQYSIDSSDPRLHKRGECVTGMHLPQESTEEAPEASPLKEDRNYRIVAPGAGLEGGMSDPHSGTNTVCNPFTPDAERVRTLVLRASNDRGGNSNSSGIRGDGDAEHSGEDGVAEDYAQHQVLRSRAEQAVERRLDILVNALQDSNIPEITTIVDDVNTIHTSSLPCAFYLPSFVIFCASFESFLLADRWWVAD